MTPDQFQSQFMPYAQQVSARTGLDPRLVLAQAALETGWGRSAPNNNYFGIKSHGQSGGNTLMTQEFQNGQMVNIPQSFRGYETPEASFQGYADFILSNPRYQRVLSQSDIGGQIEAMGQSGYATDPEYASKLSSIAQRFGADTPRAVAADTRAALGMADQGAQPQFSTRGPDQMMPPRERPQGLLQTLGVQPQGEGPQGDRPFYQRDRFKDLMGGLAVAANTLRQRPDPNIPAVVGRARQAREANRTAEWLAQQEGGAEFAQMIQNGVNPAEVLMAYRQSRQPAQTFRQARGSELGMTGESANALFNVGPDGKITAIGGAGTSITNVMGGQAGPYLYGADAGVPAGWRVNTETGEASPIPGGPADTTGQTEAAAESSAAGSVNVLEKVQDIRDEVQSNPFASGILGAIATNIPGTGAYDAAQTAGTVKANLGFDRLSQMRAESPTGGALGGVSQMELDRLESSIASLNLSQSKEQILANLSDIERQYTRILRNAYETGDPAKLDEIFGGRPSFIGGGAAPAATPSNNVLTFNPETGAFD